MDWNRFAMEWAQSSLSACWLRSCFRRLEALLRVNGLQVFVDALLSFYGANELLDLFLVVRFGGPPLLDRYGHFSHLDTKRIATVEAWFRRNGPLAIVVGR